MARRRQPRVRRVQLELSRRRQPGAVGRRRQTVLGVEHVERGLTRHVVQRPPYFTFATGDFRVLWPTAGAAGPAALTVASRVGPTATPARAFLDSLAVNSHVDQNGFSAATMLTMLNYLGVKTIRDGWKPDTNQTFTTLAQNGVHFDLGVSDPYAAGAFAGAEAVSAMAPGALTAVEGPNEINNWSFVTEGQTSNHGWPNDAGPLVQKFMTKLFRPRPTPIRNLAACRSTT